MKTSLILPVVLVFFIIAHTRPCAAQQERVEDIAAQIRAEAVRSNFDPIGRPLPLVSAWGSMPDQIKLVEQGHFYVPAFWNKFVGTPEIWYHDGDNTWDSARYQPEFKRAAELKLPVVFVTITGIIHAHESLLARPPYSDLPPAQNPMAFDAQGQPLKVLSPFGPVEHWRDLGRRWAAAERMKKVQEWYPDPPLIMFLSNNEMGVLEWYHAERDARCPPNLRTTKNRELKCKAVTDGFIERYRALQGAWKEGLSESWRKAATFVGYNAFGVFRVGWHPDWQTRWSLQYKDRISPYPLMWDGGSPSYYGTGNSANNRADGQEIDLQNWVFMARDALKLNPNFWVEFSIWDGEDAPPEIATKPNSIRKGWVEGRKDQYYKSLGLTYTAQHYAGYAQFGLWVLRPRLARRFGTHDRDWNAEKPHFIALCDSVGRVHRDPVLREWWRKGELVPNTATPSPWSQAMAGPFEKEHRWFVLDTDVNPTFDPVKYGIDYSQTKYEVFSFALTRGSAGSRQWLVYAYSPERHHSRVKLKIPRYGRAVTVDAPVGGAFYEVDERGGTVKFLPPPERLATFASAQPATPAAPAATTPAAPSIVTPTAPASESDATYLSDLPEEDPVVGFGAFGKNGQLGFQSLRITVNGKSSPKGLSTHAKAKGQASVGYTLGAQYATLKTEIAVNDSAAGSFKSSLTFIIKGDGKELWRSTEVTKVAAPQAAEVSVAGVQKLELIVDCPGAYDFAQAVWIEPRLFKTGAAPAVAMPATAAPVAPADPQLAALHTAWTARFDAEANKPFETAISTLNTAYLRALDTSRAAAKNNGALAEVLAIDAEIQQIKTSAAPATDAADTPPALTTLRKTWRDTTSKHAAARDTKLTQLRAQYTKALDALIIDLTKANKIDEAKRAQQFRDGMGK